jgi:hypothetical protein
MWSWVNYDVVGSATSFRRASVGQELETGTTANSQLRNVVLRSGTSTIWCNRGSGFCDWSRPVDFHIWLLRAVANTEGIFRVILGKRDSSAFGIIAEGDYIALEFGGGANPVFQNLHLCRAGSLTTTPVGAGALGSSIIRVLVRSNNGNVQVFANELLLATSTLGPNAVTTGTANIGYEIQNGVTAANFSIRTAIQVIG